MTFIFQILLNGILVILLNKFWRKFKLFGGAAAKVFKCGLAKIPNAAVRLQSAREYYFFYLSLQLNQSQIKHTVKLLQTEILLSMSE